MRRSIVVVAVFVVAGVAVAAMLNSAAHRSVLPVVGHLRVAGPAAGPAPRPGGETPAATLTAQQVRSTATRWVRSMWTRPVGHGPFDWLGQVADITTPDLLAELRSARVTLNDQLTIAVTVDIDGVYPSAADPGTVTVTCVARRRSTTGVADEPCATTVTVVASPDGQPAIAAVQ